MKKVSVVALRRQPVVTVVIPCYNYGRYLPAAVDSVLGQRGVSTEIIIVDDASSDGSATVAEELASRNPNITVVRHETNAGHIATYNDGLARASGDYVVLLSADDLLAPGALARATALMEAHPNVGLVYGFAPEFTEVPPAPSSRRESWSLWSGSEWIGRICARGTNIIVNPEAVLRRSVMDALEGYRSDMPQAADMDLWIRAAKLADVGRVNGPPQAFYRVHGGNMHVTLFGTALVEAKARLQVFDELSETWEIDESRKAALLTAARRAIAIEAIRTADRLRDVAGTGPDEAAALLTGFAAETYPAVTRTLTWRAYHQRGDGPLSGLRSALDARLYRLRWSFRWRRWRRAGI